MKITSTRASSPWLLLVFTLPSSKASERVQIWRKLQRFGSIPFRNAGSILPNGPIHQERFEWLAATIREHGGEASVLEIQTIDDISPTMQQEAFRRARNVDYAALLDEVEKLTPAVRGASGQMPRLRRRYEEIVAIDFFENPMRFKAEAALTRAEQPQASAKTGNERAAKADYQHRTWITRPRPGIDRVSSAWLITRFIDSGPEFVFGGDPAAHAEAVPFDMFQGAGFGHEEDRCTFETLCLAFDVNDRRVLQIAEAIHDADLEDGKFGRSEGNTMNQILKGWAAQGIPDDELLRRGINLTEGLYHSIP
jgi:hypothetical protein